MIIYDKERKTLVVPEGIGCECSGGDCAEEYRQGYQSGYESGSTDGFNTGYDSGYTEGYAQGQEDCPQCSGSTPCDCSSAITEAYQSGVTEGMAEQKALLSSTAITSNGTYTSENGWNSVDVNVTVPIFSVTKRFNIESGDTSPWTVLPDYTRYMTEVIVTDNGYGQGKYDEGYAAGQAACSGGTSCNLQDDYEIYLDGSETAGQMPILPNEGYDGISEGRVFYMEAYQNQWNSGHTSGFTDGYQSGYTEGYTQGQADCPQCSGGTGCNLEEKQVLLQSGDVGVWPVSPSAGYDGMYSVVVSDDGYGQAKYSEGYADGDANGYAVGEQYGFENGYQSGYTDGYNSAITANCGTAIEEAYQSGYTEGYDAAGTKIYSSSKDVYFDELAWVDVENSTAYSEEDIIVIDYKWGSTVTGINPIVLFSNESYDPAALNPPSPTTPSFSIVLHTAGPNITTDDGQGNRVLWVGLTRSAQSNHSYRLIVQTYSYTNNVTIKAALIDLTSGEITTGATYDAVHFTGATSLSYCINGYRNTVDGVYQGMNTDWYLGGIKIFDNTGRMKHNYHFLNGCISDVVNDLETGYEAKYYDNSVEAYYSLTGVEETMRFFL